MLRRKLILTLGSVVVVLLVTALGAIMLLQSMLSDLDHVNREAEGNTAAAARFGETLAAFESEVNRRILADGHDVAIDLTHALAVLSEQTDQMFEAFKPAEPELEDLHQTLTTRVPELEMLVAGIGPEQTAAIRDARFESILDLTIGLREQLTQFKRLSRIHTLSDHERLVARFRLTVIGLGLLFLVLINVSLMVLLHAGAMILRPLGALTDASRRLARGEFDHRIELPGGDEFGELADSYNQLAAELQRSELRRLETLHQVARTLNHELNNAISIIELQLRILETSPRDATSAARAFVPIHETLQRITRTVEALKHVRRIVLTDYVAGVKMLDLERSVEEAPLIEMPRGESSPEIHTA
jgi:methyl-accepting chemotaxis protein